MGLTARFCAGVFELLPHLPRLALRLRTAAEAVRASKPHCVLTVDYKVRPAAPCAVPALCWTDKRAAKPQGFNLRLQRAVRSSWPSGTLRPAGVQLVSPSVWAFRGGEARARRLAQAVDEVLCILPFEPPLLQRAGVAATFVGHPVLEDCEWRDGQWGLREAFAPPSRSSDDAAAPLLCVLLGSREQEVARHSPLFGEAVLRLRERVPGLRLLLPTLPPLRAAVAAAASGWTIPFELADGADVANRCAFCCMPARLNCFTVTFLSLPSLPRMQVCRLFALRCCAGGLWLRHRAAGGGAPADGGGVPCTPRH